MLKFILAGRRKREDTQHRYFYEWGNIHVALMLANPVVLTLFQRYTQHYSVTGVSSNDLPLPLSPMEWDSMADHWLLSYDDLLQALIHPEYVARMQPHKFGDDSFHVALMAGKTVAQAPNFLTGGGVKLLLWGAPKERSDTAETAARWGSLVHMPLMQSSDVHLRKYVHNTPRPIDPAMFRGTLFARGGINEFAFIDEVWFESVDDLRRFCTDLMVSEIFANGIRDTLDVARSFAMVVTERVVYDAVTEGEKTPRPAVQRSDSLEARVAAQGGSDWEIPGPSNSVSRSPIGSNIDLGN